MPKQPRIDLASAVHGAARAREEKTPALTAATRPGSSVAKSRQGKRALLIYVEPEVRRSLRLRAVEEDTTMQALCVEALTRLLAERQRGQ